MTRYFCLVFSVFVANALAGAGAGVSADESCDCPKLKCDPCTVAGPQPKFYASKCGPQNSRLRSCARPLCVPLTEPTRECPVVPTAESDLREPIEVEPPRNAGAETAAETHVVGAVKVLAGGVTLSQGSGKVRAITNEANVREADTLETASDGRALVNFRGGNRVHVHPGTILSIREYRDEDDAESRRAFLQLVKGKIRNQVQQKYNDKTSFYRVYTAGAVAGVRGTEFVVEHVDHAKELETSVQVLAGSVALSSLDDKQKVKLGAGERASFRASLDRAASSPAELDALIRRGTLTPAAKISAEDLKVLEASSRVDLARADLPPAVVPGESPICREPRGFFNQCAWTSNVGAGAVQCVRTRCNANGVWAESTLLSPLRARAHCVGATPEVGACDY